MLKPKGMKTSEQPTKPEEDYEARDAAETIMKAREHLANKDLMPRVHAHVGRKLKALTGMAKMKSIDDIKAYRNKKHGPKNEMESPMEEMMKDEEKD